MRGPVPREPAPSPVDGDGVRILPVSAPAGSFWIWPAALVAALVIAVVIVRNGREPQAGIASASQAGATERDGESGQTRVRSLSELKSLPRAQRITGAPVAATNDVPTPEPPSNDPNDLATYFSPGDAEPTMGELIEALNDAGIREGIGAFNPPGTSPPLSGIRVPDDYVLPPGYVRHYQVTDQGEPIDPILMFAPDFAFFDEAGNPVAIPESRVVPPELVPPGLVVEIVDIPPP